MNLNEIKEIKGFMPNHEGMALFKWAQKFSKLGHILEIGTYCGKSSIYLSFGAKKTINMFIQLIIIKVLKSINLMKNILIMRYMTNLTKELTLFLF